jgi:predicted permease
MTLLARLAALFRKRQLDQRVDDEMLFHLEMQIEENIRRGLSPQEARRQARISSGGLEQAKELHRDARGSAFIERLFQDLRLASRRLRQSPGVTAAAVLSLALGIGANTAVFSLLEQVMLRTLPVESPEELVYLYSDGPRIFGLDTDEAGGAAFSYPLFQDLQQQQTPFVGMAGARNLIADLAGTGIATRTKIRVVSGNYFELLGVRPTLGRLIEPSDDSPPDGHAVAVLDYRFWQSRFGGDASALNQTLIVNKTPLTIVGVAPRGFTSERQGTPPDMYVPLSMNAEIYPFAGDLSTRRQDWLTMFGRLKPGMTLERAQTEINVPFREQLEIDLQFASNTSDQFLADYRSRTITLRPGQHGRGGLREESSKPLLLMMGMTLLVLLLACANVAGLQLARGAARVRDSAVRLALGGSRPGLIGTFLLESSLISLFGGLAGLIVARIATGAILMNVPSSRGLGGYLSAELNLATLLFCLGISLLTGIAFGLFPALKLSGVSVAPTLKSQAGQSTLGRSANTFRKTLVTAQVAITLLLLTTSGLLVKSLVNLARIDLGFKTEHLATFGLFPGMAGFSPEQSEQLHDALTERLAAIPGVSLVSTAQAAVVADQRITSTIAIEGFTPEPGQKNPSVHRNLTGTNYFRTMGVPLAAGREFTLADNSSAPKVAIVNEAFARKFLSDRNAIGAHIEQQGQQWRIVGIVRDSAYEGIRQAPPPAFYLPLSQSGSWFGFRFYVRTATPPEGLLGVLQREAAAVAPSLPVVELKTVEMQLQENTYGERIVSILTSAFAGLAVLLAAIGLYGVLAFSVSRRRREIGIRMALGAESSHVPALVAREVTAVMLIGTGSGLVAAAFAARSLEPFLYRLSHLDPLTYVGAIAVLWSTAVAAAYMPTRRAVRIDPIAALRYE